MSMANVTSIYLIYTTTTRTHYISRPFITSDCNRSIDDLNWPQHFSSILCLMQFVTKSAESGSSSSQSCSNLLYWLYFCFWGNNFGIMSLITYISYITMGSMFLLGPVVLGKYFGLKYHGRNFGTVVFATDVVTLIRHVLLGLSYDDKVTCLGLHCYYESMSILIALTFVTLCTSLVL